MNYNILEVKKQGLFMQVSNTYNNNLQFGHSFRVNICLKNPAGGENVFVNPYSDKQLYKTLNSKIVGWLNEDYYANIRNFFGVKKKVNKSQPINDIHNKMIRDLQKIDGDYATFQHARSIYNGGRLAYIVTGADVPIVENLKGLKQIGISKSDFLWTNQDAYDQYIRTISKAVRNNILSFVKSDNTLLRSQNDKEIMLKAVFKEAGKNSKGSPIYELDNYEFHENISKPVLNPIDANFSRFKRGDRILEEIKKTVQHHIFQITRKRVNLTNKNLKHIISSKKSEPQVKS